MENFGIRKEHLNLPVQDYDRGSRTYNISGTWIYNDKKANTYQSYIFFNR